MNTIKTDLKASLLEYFGFDSFKGEQEKVISNQKSESAASEAVKTKDEPKS